MEVTVNQKTYQINSGCNIQYLFTDVLHQNSSGLAIAINQTIIPKAQWSEHQLQPNDQIIIIKATQGG